MVRAHTPNVVPPAIPRSGSHVVPGFLVEGLLVGQGQSSPAILLRVGDAGEASIEQLALDGPLDGDPFDRLVIGAPGPRPRSGRIPPLEVGLQPGPGLPAEVSMSVRSSVMSFSSGMANGPEPTLRRRRSAGRGRRSGAWSAGGHRRFGALFFQASVRTVTYKPLSWHRRSRCHAGSPYRAASLVRRRRYRCWSCSHV